VVITRSMSHDRRSKPTAYRDCGLLPPSWQLYCMNHGS
jgi:hypothetical protein